MTDFNSRSSARYRENLAQLIRRTVTSAIALLALLLAAAVALPAKTLPAAFADSTVPLCGQQINNADPSYDLSGLLQMTQQGNNQIVSAIVQGTGLGAQWCGPIQWMTEIAAEVVVDGTLLEVVDIHTPKGIDIAVAVTRSALDNAQAGQPTTLPDVGGSGTTIWAPVAWATAGINIRTAPNTSAPPIGSVPDGTPLLLQCSTSGENVTSAGGATDVWDQVTYNGVTGYVADAFINTGQLTPAVPAC